MGILKILLMFLWVLTGRLDFDDRLLMINC